MQSAGATCASAPRVADVATYQGDEFWHAVLGSHFRPQKSRDFARRDAEQARKLLGGWRTSPVETRQIGVQFRAVYDGLHRLSDADQGMASNTTGVVSDADFEQRWTLDQLGNWQEFKQDADGDGSFTGASDLDQDRQHNSVNEIDTDDTHGDADDPITAGTGQADWIDPVYDAAGNMVEGPSPLDPTVKQKYVYDAWNRMVEVTDDSDATIITNEYDGLGRRIVKDVAGGETHEYYYNDRWQLLTEVKDGSAYAIYHWHPFYVDALAARMRAGDTHFFLHDATFNVTAAVEDSTNNVVERYAYTPYGEVTVLDADFTLDSDGGDGLSDIGNTHLYTGRERDPETGLQLNRHRFFAAHLGRWVNRDPIGYEGSPYNLYEYVASSPIVGLDPEGTRLTIGYRYTSYCRCGAGPINGSVSVNVFIFYQINCFSVFAQCSSQACIEYYASPWTCWGRSGLLMAPCVRSSIVSCARGLGCYTI